MDAAYPTGRLTRRDVANALPNTADSLPWAQSTEPQHIGSTFRAPAPCREVDPEYEHDRAALLAELVDAQAAWQSQWQAQQPPLPDRLEDGPLFWNSAWPSRAIGAVLILAVIVLLFVIPRNAP